MISEPFRPVIHTQADLEAAWRHLMGEFGSPTHWSRQSAWLMLIDPDGRPIPQLVEIEDLESLPKQDDLDGLAHFLEKLADEADLRPRVAFLIARPGHDGVRTGDRVWAAGMYDATRRAGLPCETVHLANDLGVTPVPLDELGVA